MTRTAAENASQPVEHPSFDQFVATIAALRAPDGCPWDREQTHQSIAHNMIEEAYEAVDAIEAGDVAHLREELGDVLLQVVLQSQIAADEGAFDIDDVCADVNAKMVRRHPHVFGEERARNAGEVLDLWDQVKLSEKGQADQVADDQGERRAGLLDGVPASFPALMQAQKISRKAAASGFEWDALEDVWDKVREEIAELREAYAAAPKTANGKVDASAAARPEGASATADDAASAPAASAASAPAATDGASAGARDSKDAAALVAAVEEELGDVLFSLVNVARRMGVNAESALRGTCCKFRDRWAFMEGAAWAQGRRVEDLAPDEREALWDQAKRQAGE